MGRAFTLVLLVTSTATARMDAEVNDWSETAQTSKLGRDSKWYRPNEVAHVPRDMYDSLYKYASHRSRCVMQPKSERR